jgi:hypothetical protein
MYCKLLPPSWNVNHIFYLDGSGVSPSSLVPTSPSSPSDIRVMTRLPLPIHLLLPRDFPFLPCLGRTTFSVGDSRAVSMSVCCLPSVGKVGGKSPFRSGLSKLCFDCFDSSLWPLRARGLLVATVMWVFRRDMQRGVLFTINLVFVWVCYCPIQYYFHGHIIG